MTEMKTTNFIRKHYTGHTDGQRTARQFVDYETAAALAKDWGTEDNEWAELITQEVTPLTHAQCATLVSEGWEELSKAATDELKSAKAALEVATERVRLAEGA